MRTSLRLGLLATSLLVAACSDGSQGGSEGEGNIGSVHAALKAVSPHDVVSVHYKVVSSNDDCTGAAIAETTVALEEENLPTSVQPPGGGDSHRFADALFTAPAGDYVLCATPLAKSGEPSVECAQASVPVSVIGGTTAEVVLASQCVGDPSGGLDGVTVLNDPPHVDSITIAPSKFITACEEANIALTATDPNGDNINDYAWTIVSGPAGASLVGSGASAVFNPADAGDYLLSVTVSDIYKGQSSLSFPIHVSPCACGPIFTETFADNSQGWTLGPEWQIGPTAVSSGQVYGNPDPAEDHTPTSDNGVAGVVLGGNASTQLHGYYYLTSPVIDAADTKSLSLSFFRWLNSDYVPFMSNSVEVFNGTTWIPVWQSGGAPGVLDNAWMEQKLDISAYANANLQVRFGFTITNSGVFTVSSWNVDDVTITANAEECEPPPSGGTTFTHAFSQGNTTQEACDAWDGFRAQLASGTFQSVTLHGSVDTTGQTCGDPALATQICNALSAGTPISVSCGGHFWNVGTCGQEVRNGNVVPAIELSVDDPICTCTNGPGHSVRPCIQLGLGDNPNWGGAGTNTCSAPAQTLEVLCQ